MKIYSVELNEHHAQELIIENFGFTIVLSILDLPTDFRELIKTYAKFFYNNDNNIEDAKAFINEDIEFKISRASTILIMRLRNSFDGAYSIYNNCNNALFMFLSFLRSENILYDVISQISDYNNDRSVPEYAKMLLAKWMSESVEIDKAYLDVFLRGWFTTDFKIKILEGLVARDKKDLIEYFYKAKSPIVKTFIINHIELDKLPFYMGSKDTRIKQAIEKRLSKGI